MVHQPELLSSWKVSIQNELDHILQFWINHTVDYEFGGFHGEISNDLIVNPAEPKGLVLNARILWTYSKAYLVFKHDKYLVMAQRAYEYINHAFLDREFGGYYWHVDLHGKPLNTRKQIYGQAFVIYGFTEYYKASGDPASLQKAINLYEKIEEVSYDNVHSGYYEAYKLNWELEDDLRLSGSDLNEAKSMNTHLHILEAYSNLITVWEDDELKRRQKTLLHVMKNHIVDEKQQHFKLFFDEAWHSKSEHISFGHDIEGSWLLVEAAQILQDSALVEQWSATAITMAEAVLQHGVDSDGALWNEAAQDYRIVDAAKDWWPQAEAAVGFLNAYQLSGREEFLAAAIQSWDFIIHHLVDTQHGEWFWQVSAERKPVHSIAKVSPWKCPYHNSRACFELLERLKHITV